MRFKPFFLSMFMTLLAGAFVTCIFFAGRNTMNVGFSEDERLFDFAESGENGFSFFVMGREVVPDFERAENAARENNPYLCLLPDSLRLGVFTISALWQDFEKFLQEYR